jgi:hypothetical protein
VRVALGGIEEEVADAGARDMLVLLRNVGEDDAVGDFRSRPHVGSLFEVGLAEVGEAEEPEDGVGETFEDAEPGAEGGGFDLDRLVD